MPTILPSKPAYFLQNDVTPASIATRLRQPEGRMLSRYSAGWRSKRSVHGMETTRVPAPNSFAAAMAS